MRKISEILHDTRIEKGYTLEQVVRSTKIKKLFLIAIENGEYEKLPSESYALGFVKNYASLLGIDKVKASALFRREYEGSKSKMLPTFKSQEKSVKRIVLLTPRNIIIGLVILVIFGYIGIQYSSFFLGPRLEVLSPQDRTVVRNNIVEVSGRTDPYATVLINNEESYVALDGTFKKTLYLFEGQKQIVIDSKNRNGKNTRRTIGVTVR